MFQPPNKILVNGRQLNDSRDSLKYIFLSSLARFEKLPEKPTNRNI